MMGGEGHGQASQPAQPESQRPAKKDRHITTFTARLSASDHAKLILAARKSHRPMTWELHEALRKHFLEVGIETDDGSDTST